MKFTRIALLILLTALPLSAQTAPKVDPGRVTVYDDDRATVMLAGGDVSFFTDARFLDRNGRAVKGLTARLGKVGRRGRPMDIFVDGAPSGRYSVQLLTGRSAVRIDLVVDVRAPFATNTSLSTSLSRPTLTPTSSTPAYSMQGVSVVGGSGPFAALVPVELSFDLGTYTGAREITLSSSQSDLFESFPSTVSLGSGEAAGVTLQLGEVAGARDITIEATAGGQTESVTFSAIGPMPSAFNVSLPGNRNQGGAMVAPGSFSCGVAMDLPPGMPSQEVTLRLSTDRPDLVQVEDRTRTLGSTANMNGSCQALMGPAGVHPVTITAEYGGESISTTVSLTRPSLAGTTLYGGDVPSLAGSSRNLGINLSAPPPLNEGITVALATDRPDLVTVPSELVINPQSTSAGFTMEFAQAELSGPEPFSITASWNGEEVTYSGELHPAYVLQDLRTLFNRPFHYPGRDFSLVFDLYGGNQLERTISLSTDRPEVFADFPSEVVIQPGEGTGVPFDLVAPPATTPVTVQATAGGMTREVTFTVGRAELVDFALGSLADRVTEQIPLPGQSLGCQVRFQYPGGTPPNYTDTLRLESDRPDVLTVTENTAIPFGTMNGDVRGFACNLTGEVQEPTPVTVTASLGSSIMTATMTVLPEPVARVQSLTLSAPQVRTGSAVTATLSLSAPVGSQGLQLTSVLGNEHLIAGIPSSISFGETGVSFTVSVGSQANVSEPIATTIEITDDQGGSATADLEILPPYVFNGITVDDAQERYFTGDDLALRLGFQGSGSAGRAVSVSFSDPSVVSDRFEAEQTLSSSGTDVLVPLVAIDADQTLTVTVESMGETHSVDVELAVPRVTGIEFWEGQTMSPALLTEVEAPAMVQCRILLDATLRDLHDAELTLEVSHPELIGFPSTTYELGSYSSDSPHLNQPCNLTNSVSAPTEVEVIATLGGESTTGRLTLLPTVPGIVDVWHSRTMGQTYPTSGLGPAAVETPVAITVRLDQAAPLSGFALEIDSSDPDLVPVPFELPVADTTYAWFEVVPQPQGDWSVVPREAVLTIRSGDSETTETLVVYPDFWIEEPDNVEHIPVAPGGEGTVFLQPQRRPLGSFSVDRPLSAPSDWVADVTTSHPDLIEIDSTVAPDGNGNFTLPFTAAQFTEDADVEVTLSIDGRSVTLIVPLRVSG